MQFSPGRSAAIIALALQSASSALAQSSVQTDEVVVHAQSDHAAVRGLVRRPREHDVSPARFVQL